MDERELPSDSDSSDEDFVPEGVDSDLPSEEDSGPDDAELDAANGSEDDDNASKGQKRSAKRKSGNKRKRLKKNSVKEVVEEINNDEKESLAAEQAKLTVEEEKKKADSLWADFMKDVGGPPRKQAAAASSVTKGTTPESPSPAVKTTQPKPVPTEKENKVTITELFEFAGEEVKVTKEVSVDSPEARLARLSSDGPSSGGGRATSSVPPVRGRGGLSAVLSQIGKKTKISTLEKSKLDWEAFKHQEGIEEEIQTFNRGKDGYLEKQDFLQRADLRQFEIEKQLRANRRSNR